MHITGLFLYPVKSLRGFAVSTVELDELGLSGDRRFLIVDETGKFQTQREHPRMALIGTALVDGRLVLSADGAGRIEVPVSPDANAPLRSVTVWKSEGLLAEDCGEPVARWLEDFLGWKCRLVRIGPRFRRPVLKKAAQPGDLVSFADAAPLLVVGEASREHLNARIQENGGEPVPMDRFRPNLVVGGCPAFAEDEWPRIRIGDVMLRSAGKSARCIVTTMHQQTGERGKEPLRTLAAFRRDPADPTAIYFGVNFIHETKRGALPAGAKVEIL